MSFRERATMHERINRLAEKLCLTPCQRGASLYHARDGRWWLVGCLEGDQPLPETLGKDSPEDVLDHMEAWLEEES